MLTQLNRNIQQFTFAYHKVFQSLMLIHVLWFKSRYPTINQIPKSLKPRLWYQLETTKLKKTKNFFFPRLRRSHILYTRLRRNQVFRIKNWTQNNPSLRPSHSKIPWLRRSQKLLPNLQVWVSREKNLGDKDGVRCQISRRDSLVVLEMFFRIN